MANTRRSSRGASRQGTTAEPTAALRWYGAGLGSGLFIAFLLYLVTLPVEQQDAAATAPEPRSAARAAIPEYTFYDVLPGEKVGVDAEPAQPPAPRTGESGKQYVLQAGSFRDARDADSRRAKLLLLGLEPRVEEAHGDTGRWFRVVLGPFPSRSDLAKARSLTAQQDIDTLLMQRDPG